MASLMTWLYSIPLRSYTNWWYLHDPRRKHGTSISVWQQQLVSQIGVSDHAPVHLLGEDVGGVGSRSGLLVHERPARAIELTHKILIRLVNISL